MSINDYRPSELATHRKTLSDIRESQTNELTITNKRAISSHGKAAMINRNLRDELDIKNLESLDVSSLAYYDSL